MTESLDRVEIVSIWTEDKNGKSAAKLQEVVDKHANEGRYLAFSPYTLITSHSHQYAQVVMVFRPSYLIPS